MRERTGRRLRRLCGGGLLGQKAKTRAVSLDETVKSLQSLALSESSRQDEFSEIEGSQHQGASSKATTVLFRRLIDKDCCNDDGNKKSIVEEELSPSELLAKEPAAENRNKCSLQMTKRQDPSVLARKEAIRAQQKLLGKHHPDVLFSLECLMRFHRERGEHNEALLVYEEKQRLSRESYWNRSRPNEQGIPTNIVVAHE